MGRRIDEGGAIIQWAYDYLVHRGLAFSYFGVERIRILPGLREEYIPSVDWQPGPDRLLCIRCRSTPRHRGVLLVLDRYVPDWRRLRIHESSPDGGASSARIRSECPKYLPHSFSLTCPSVGRKTESAAKTWSDKHFADKSFDLVLTQDVFEHMSIRLAGLPK